jgi:peptide/nickel transport system permease protein
MAQVGTTEQPVAAGGPRPTGGEITADVVGRSPGQLFWRRFRKDRFALAGVIVIAVIILLAIAAPYIEVHVAGHDKNAVDLHALDQFGLPGGPNGQYWFGVDEAGRDLFVRVIYGARTSLTIAVAATGMSVVIGVVLGLLSGFYRGKVDTFISRFTDVVLSLPVLLLSLGLVSACGISKEGCLGGLLSPGLTLVSIVIGLFSWPYISRIVRGQVLSLREKEFVEASRSLGASNWRIVFREILPNVAAPIIVYATLIIPNNVLFEAALSFLGVGVPPETPSWGRMLSEASNHIESWWMMLFPGLFLLMTTLAFNLVGDGLRDALDPRDSR